jgi:Fe-S-cluster containining protein
MMKVAEKDIFNCRQCGHCCQGETTVSLNVEDQDRLIAYLRKPRQEVVEKYLRITDGVVQMKTVDGHCIFYTKQGCSVHPGKPWRCGQWPLHESILGDQANFSAIKDSCPGIKGEMGYESFCRKFTRYLDQKKKQGRK